MPSPEVLHRQDPEFVSLTLDTSVVLGGHWWGPTKGTSQGLSRDRTAPLDLSQPDLSRWAEALAPAMLRMGGTEADRILYGFAREGPPEPAPVGAVLVLKGKRWDEFNRWAAARGFSVLFTVSAGPEVRDADGRWTSAGAERLLRKTVRKGYPVVAWEFGNEVNAYPFLFGLRHAVSPRQYLADFARFADLVRRLAPGTRTVGPASAIWPLVGEPNPLIPALGRSPVSAFLDVLSFHYYPQQSDRGRVAVRRAGETNLLNPRALDGSLRWLRHARRSLQRGSAATAPIWLTELGHALYGGQAGVSDTWLSTPWWLDQLGLLSHAGVGALFRQSLVGGDYGLLDPATWQPRPDYWATVAWKRLMGPLVHAKPLVRGPDRRLRVWHHAWPDGRSCLVVVNLSRKARARITVEGGVTSWDVLSPAGSWTSREATWNGALLSSLADLVRFGDRTGPAPSLLELGPLSCAFAELPQTPHENLAKP